MSQRAIKATAWSGADILVRTGFQFLVLIILARLLTPSEFGTVALLSLFTGVATVLVDGGMSTALIQRQDITRTDESTVFWANVALGAVLALVLGLMAPAIAHFYDSDVLVPLTWVMAANLVISAFGTTQIALLTKKLEFRTLLFAGAVSSIISGALAIVMAYRGLGVWALAAQIVVMSALSTVLLWALSDWRPTATFSRSSARKLLGFGGYVFLANLADAVFTRLYTLLGGRLFGVREVGIYNRADTAQQIPVDLLSSIVSRVALPVFSVAAEEKEQLRHGAQRAIRVLMLLNVPAMLGLAALADPFVLAVFGNQWSDVVPILQVLCLSGALWPLHVVNVYVLLAQGHARLLLVLELVKKSVGVTLLVAGAVSFGLIGLAWGQVAFGVVAFVVNAYYTKRMIGYGVAGQTLDVLPVFVVALPVAAAALYVVRKWDVTPVIELLSIGALGAGLFLLAAWALRLPALTESVSILRQVRQPEVREEI